MPITPVAPLTWINQPARLEFCRVVISSLTIRHYGSDYRVEVRKYDPREGRYFVTIGTLFDSSTFECDSASIVLETIEWLSKSTGTPPAGCRRAFK